MNHNKLQNELLFLVTINIDHRKPALKDAKSGFALGFLNNSGMTHILPFGI
jgi:hypothetical protein